MVLEEMLITAVLFRTDYSSFQIINITQAIINIINTEKQDNIFRLAQVYCKFTTVTVLETVTRGGL